ncbi:MFS transporter [Streptomyces sp. HNM0663]|uniref:MFS transporter n=1 Tax=Streptomyces chengmaiensis TaxID=3040919 RepID=A0ABT6HQ45_9ACTN|nr:MFS transporter [Streptomyces chengmaiensis]MDH2390816.1 MFS transporter [Streptomyces chengmaiensis]
MAVPETTRTTGAGPEPHPRRRMMLSLMLVALFMNLLDVTVVTVALPAMRDGLGAGHAASQWFLAAYTLAFGAGVITGGRLGDRYGRRTLFLLGVGCFTAASAACGLAPDAPFMIVARTLQGLAAALMVPQVMATVYAVFPLRERAGASAAFGAVTGVASVVGPLLGGVFVTYDVAGLGWRGLFLINVPVGLVALAASWALIPDTRAERPLRMDLVGVALVTAGLLCALYPLVQGEDAGWPAWMLISLACAPPLLALYAAHARVKDRRDRSALVPLRLFALPGFSPAVAVLFTVHIVMIAFFVAVSVTLQNGLGYTALRTGLTFLPWAVGGGIASQLLRWAVPRLGRNAVSLGALLAAAGLLWFALALDADAAWWQLAPGTFLGGVGTVAVIGPAFMYAGTGVEPGDAGAASGACGASVQLGGALGTALLGVLLLSGLPVSAGTGPPAGSEEASAAAEAFADAFGAFHPYAVGGLVLVALIAQALPRDATPYR